MSGARLLTDAWVEKGKKCNCANEMNSRLKHSPWTQPCQDYVGKKRFSRQADFPIFLKMGKSPCKLAGNCRCSYNTTGMWEFWVTNEDRHVHHGINISDMTGKCWLFSVGMLTATSNLDPVKLEEINPVLQSSYEKFEYMNNSFTKDEMEISWYTNAHRK